MALLTTPTSPSWTATSFADDYGAAALTGWSGVRRNIGHRDQFSIDKANLDIRRQTQINGGPGPNQTKPSPYSRLQWRAGQLSGQAGWLRQRVGDKQVASMEGRTIVRPGLDFNVEGAS